MKDKIVELLEQNPNSGYFAAEIASIIGFSVHDVGPLLKNDTDFFYDKGNSGYVGWRLSKYR